MNNGLCRSVTTPAIGESFDEVVPPHLDAAYRLARWLMRNEHDAEDVRGRILGNRRQRRYWHEPRG